MEFPKKVQCKHCEGSGCEDCMFTGKLWSIPRYIQGCDPYKKED